MTVDKDRVAKAALKYIQRGQFAKAIDEYKRVLAADPRDVRTRLKLIDLYSRAGRRREAVQECLQVAEAYSEQGFYLKAIAVYKQAVRVEPDNPQLHRNMAEMYAKQGLTGDALAAFKAAAELLRRQGKSDEAERLLVRMEEMAPENAAIKVHLAELYLEDRRYGAFEGEVTKLVLQLRGEGRSRKLLQAMEAFYEKSGHHPSVLLRLAELYVDLGEEGQALGVIREGLAREPENRNLRLLALRAHLVLGQLPEARRMALALYEEDPDDVNIIEQLAAIAQARGDTRELAQAHRAMAQAYGRQGLVAREHACFRKVLELLPEDAEARLVLGEVATAEPEEEVVELEAAWEGGEASTAPDSVREGLVEAELYLKYGLEEKAADKLRELTELAPGEVEIRVKLRDLLQRRGDRAGWVREQLHIAGHLLRDGRESEALRAHQAILEVQPDCAEARKAIQYLRPSVVTRPSVPIEIDLDGATVEFVGGADGEEQVVHRRPLEDGGADEEIQEGLSEADFYEAQGLVEEALRVLRGLRERFPASPHVANRLARLGDDGSAPPVGDFFDLQKEVLDVADVTLASSFEGFQEFEVSELDDIVKEFKSGIAEKIDAGDYETHYNLGLAYREMGLLEDAAREFQQAARSPVKSRDAYTSLAMLLGELGRAAEAAGALRLALAAPTNTPGDRAAILYELGALAEEEGDLEGALAAFARAAEADPGVRDVGARVRKLQARLGR